MKAGNSRRSVLLKRIAVISVLIGLPGCAQASDWDQTRGKALAAAQRQDYPEAMALFRQLWADGRGDIELAAAAQDLGTLLHYLGQEREAEVWLARGVEHWRRVAGSPQRLPQNMLQLGVVHRRLGDYAGAEAMLREALAMPQISAETRVKTINALADLVRDQGHMTEVRQLLRQTAGVPGLPWNVQIDSLMGIAGLEREAGSALESVARWSEALELARANHSVSYEAVCLRGLGDALQETHEVARAIPLLRRSVYLVESVDSPEPTQREIFQLANSRRSLAEAELMDRKPLEAEELAQQAIDDVEKASLATHPQAAALFDTLAEALAARGKLGPALEALQRAKSILVAHFGDQSTIAIATASKKGVLEERAGHSEEAVRDLGAAITGIGRDRTDLARTRLRLLEYYAAALEATHRKQQAKAMRAEIKTASIE
jgi:tetratricopeptide (TPR) repeat protein